MDRERRDAPELVATLVVLHLAEVALGHRPRRCGKLGTNGSVAYLFSKSGQITFAPGADEEKILEIALEHGATDVISEDDGAEKLKSTSSPFARDVFLIGVLVYEMLEAKELERVNRVPLYDTKLALQLAATHRAPKQLVMALAASLVPLSALVSTLKVTVSARASCAQVTW